MNHHIYALVLKAFTEKIVKTHHAHRNHVLMMVLALTINQSTYVIVQEVFMGCVVQAGVGQAPARQAALFAGQ